MDKYFSARTRVSSLISGAFVFFSALFSFSLLGVENTLMWALLVGAGAVLLFSFLTPLSLYLRDKRYQGIEETLPKPVLLKVNVSIRGKTRPRNGYLYLTEDTMYLYSRDHKPYASQELPKNQIRDLKVERDIFMTFRFANTALYSIASAQCEEILEMMHRYNWNVF